MRIKNAKFKKLISPEDTLLIQMKVIRDSFRVLNASCSVSVNDTIAASAELIIAIK